MSNHTLYSTDPEYFLEQLRELFIEALEQGLNADIKRKEAEGNPTLYTRQEAADKLKISLSALHNRINKGDIPAYRIGRRTLIKAEDIDKSLIKKIN